MCELREVIRQKVGQNFIEILNNIRIGKANDFDLDLLTKCKTNIEKIRKDITLPYPENAPKRYYNLTNLVQIPYSLLEIKAIGKFPTNILPGILRVPKNVLRVKMVTLL